MEKQLYTLGIDIGSTTVKIAILDEAKQLIFSDYRRHFLLPIISVFRLHRRLLPFQQL